MSTRSEEVDIGLPPSSLGPGLVPPDPIAVPPRRVYQRLAPALRAAAPDIEALTNPRLAAKARLSGGPASVDENSPRLQNWNHAPFAYTNPEGSYLLGPVHGVMEVAGSVAAALAIAIRRRETFLERTTSHRSISTCGCFRRGSPANSRT